MSGSFYTSLFGQLSPRSNLSGQQVRTRGERGMLASEVSWQNCIFLFINDLNGDGAITTNTTLYSVSTGDSAISVQVIYKEKYAVLKLTSHANPARPPLHCYKNILMVNLCLHSQSLFHKI